MEELLQAGADVHTPVSYKWSSGDDDWELESTAIIYAVREDLPDMVKVLLKVEKNRQKALEEAIKEHRLNVVKEFVKAKTDINCVNKYGDTPLMMSIDYARSGSWWSHTKKIIQLLLEAGADVKLVNNSWQDSSYESCTKT